MPETVASTASLWAFLPIGYALTVLIETPVLLVGLSPRHSTSLRLGCGLWLTACTYPMVVLVFPLLIWHTFGEGWYILVAETFAPLAECILFRQLLRSRPQNLQATRRDYAVITAANLASFLTGEYLF
jgi:hypothetical protein